MIHRVLNVEALFSTIPDNNIYEIESDGTDLFGRTNSDNNEFECEEAIYEDIANINPDEEEGYNDCDEEGEDEDENMDELPLTFGRAVIQHWEASKAMIEHPYSITAWVLCVVEDAHDNIHLQLTGGHQ